ncbi:MAG: hypothetical protein ACTSW1_17195 [Candidatus Hodarchaeales archaeon]
MSIEAFIIEFSTLKVRGIGKVLIKRDSSPRTVALIRFRLRNAIQSRIVVRNSEVIIPIKLGRVGPENSVKKIKRGDVAYWPQSQILIIYLKDKEVEYPVNLVGKAKNPSYFDRLTLGSPIKLERVQSPIDESQYL